MDYMLQNKHFRSSNQAKFDLVGQTGLAKSDEMDEIRYKLDIMKKWIIS